ncbi:hypothetical protein CRYUN_Cryun22dG0079500 [Craigia yunnanensis]
MSRDIEAMAIIPNSMSKEMSDDPRTAISWICNSVNFYYEKGANINASLEQGTITSLLEKNGTVKGVHYKNKNGKLLTAYAPLTIVCDGGFLNLRRPLCYPKRRNNIITMMNRIMAIAPHPTPGALLMGDAFKMRHRISGGELTVALSDVVVVRDLLRPLHNLYDAFAVCKYLESFIL